MLKVKCIVYQCTVFQKDSLRKFENNAMLDTKKLFRDDAYLKSCDANIIGINDKNGIILDQTIFYPTGGGQPGDIGALVSHGETIQIATTVNDRKLDQLVHVPSEISKLKVGDKVSATIDWKMRYQYMRMHTAMHLLCSIVPCGVTGGQVGASKSRLDFDVAESVLDKEYLSDELNRLINQAHPVTTLWVDDDYLDAHPELVKTMSVQPPRGVGKLRLLKIGDSVDLQPCGGTHVNSTDEIGAVRVAKIENKGKRNRRVHIVFED